MTRSRPTVHGQKLISASSLPHTRGPPYCHGVARCPTKRRLVIDLVSLTTFIIFHRSVLWKRVKRVEIGMEWRELESIFREFFSSFCMQHSSTSVCDFSSFFSKEKEKKEKDLLGIRVLIHVVSSLLNSRSNVWHTSGLIATESEAERWKIHRCTSFLFFFLLFSSFLFFFFFAPVVRAIACKAAIRAFNLHALFLLTNG